MKAGRRLHVTSRVAAFAALVVLFLAAAWALVAPGGSDAPGLVTVSPGQSVSDVGSMLGETGMVRSPLLFVGAAYATGKWRRIQAGRHELTPSMSALEILDALCRGERKAWAWITIPEGYTLRQIAAEVEKAQLASAADFLQEARLPADAEFPLPAEGLEGYLFPDTYRVDSGQTARGMISQMLRRFDQVVWHGLFREQPAHQGRALAEIIILASLVEAEAQKDEERAVIAGVLSNRLRQEMKLECDATVQYALGDGRKPRLTYQDLQIDSEYNTYQHPGLPPGPICSPGEASVKAAMEPASVQYLYYVARPDGSHVFSRTFAEHQAAISRLRRGK